MHKVIINKKEFTAKSGELLSDILIKNGFDTPHPCGGKGRCKKCSVTVNGESVLSCQYKIQSDITVKTEREDKIYSECGIVESESITDNLRLVLDLGTTTLAIALVSLDEKKTIKVITDINPQRAFGADVISRIEYSIKNGVDLLHKSIISKANEMIEKLSIKAEKLYVSGNTTMLHIFLGTRPDSMGKAPYTPVFLESKTVKGVEIGINNVDEVITLPSISAFVGADLVAGLNSIDKPMENKYNLLVDLGTNAEIILYGNDKILCTAAAAGPCFEGANISQGMSATDGAICEYTPDGKAKTIGKKKAVGICGTGLVDIISVILQKEIIDETGYIEEDFEVAENVYITQDDIRQYQNAKSAIYSGILTLMNIAEIKFNDVEKLYISGGFSAKINIGNAVNTGLLPGELKDKCISIGNSSLSGTIKYACENNNLEVFIENAEYIDLSKEKLFSELFVENMVF